MLTIRILSQDLNLLDLSRLRALAPHALPTPRRGTSWGSYVFYKYLLEKFTTKTNDAPLWSPRAGGFHIHNAPLDKTKMTLYIAGA